jgi:hypothetical protein
MPSGTPMSDENRNPQKITLMLCHRLSCSHGSSGRAGGVVKPVTSARNTACGGGRNTGLAGAPAAGRPLRATTSAFSAANAARSTSRSRDIHVMSPGSVTRTIGCQMNGT